MFYTCCHIRNKTCSMIIDEGGANVSSDTFVMKLSLSCVKHSRPYCLQWLTECGEVKVKNKY
jgi:hypothetical protein